VHAAKNVKRDLVFRLAAAGAVAAAAVHAAALAWPAFAAAAYPPAYPALRHAVFVAIDSALAGLFLRRPWWFVWAYAVLTAQVLYGHGGAAWVAWQRDGHVAWIDVAAIVAVPLGLAVLVKDYRERQLADGAGGAKVGAEERI
jgi:hypothetical protein